MLKLILLLVFYASLGFSSLSYAANRSAGYDLWADWAQATFFQKIRIASAIVTGSHLFLPEDKELKVDLGPICGTSRSEPAGSPNSVTGLFGCAPRPCNFDEVMKKMLAEQELQKRLKKSQIKYSELGVQIFPAISEVCESE